ncbi:RNA-directed DNA polymerase, eukaryota, reverse transcriptase zinc-binding domain protein [Tanacetum coccineum]
MSRIQSWNEIVDRMVARLSKWKKKTLSIGGRLTLLNSTLWVRVIKAINGDDEKIGKNSKSVYPSIWLDIVHELELIKKQGIDVINCIHKKLGNRANTVFWDDVWRGDVAFKHMYPRLYAMESCKNVNVATKMSYSSLDYSFRRVPRGGVEQTQYAALLAKVEGVSLVNMKDRWVWSLEGSGDFSVASIRKLIDDKMLPKVSFKTRWSKVVPIKVNVLAWKVRIDGLSTRFNISRRGIDIESILCPICEDAVESTRHIFFTCRVAKEILCKISCWWEITYSEVSSYEEWLAWILNLRLSNKHKQLLEGFCYSMW